MDFTSARCRWTSTSPSEYTALASYSRPHRTVARVPQLPSLIKCTQVRSSIYRILLTDLYQTLYMLPEANGNHSLVKTTTKQHKSRSKDEGDRRIEGYLLNPSEKSYLAPWPEIDSSIQPSLSFSFPLVKPRHTSPMAESPRTWTSPSEYSAPAASYSRPRRGCRM
jgi:hypothetical protein